MKSIMSFWSEPYIESFHNNWLNQNSWNLSWILSVEAITKIYGKPYLYTDEAGKNFLVNKLGLNFSGIDLSLNELKGKNPNFFSLGRTYAIGVQKEPFIHIDYDAYLLDKIPDNVFENGVFFEKENFFDIDADKNLAQRPELFSRLNNIPDWWNKYIDKKQFKAYKYGIVGGSNFEYFSRLSQTIFDIINSNSDNSWYEVDFLSKKETNGFVSKVFSPQYTVDEYTAYALAKEMNISPKFIIDKDNIFVTKYVHVHGEKMFSSEMYGRILKRLTTSYPQTNEIIKKLEPNRNIENNRISAIIIPNNLVSVYDTVLRVLIPRRISPDEILVSSFNLTDIDRNLLSRIDGVRIVAGGNSYLESIEIAFKKTSGQIVIIVDGHIKVPKLYIEKSVAAFMEYPDSVFCTLSSDFSDKPNHFSYGALQDDSGIRPNISEFLDYLLNTPEVSCLYGGLYVFPSKILHFIFESKIKSFSEISSLLEKNGFKIRCIKGILCSHGFKETSEHIID